MSWAKSVELLTGWLARQETTTVILVLHLAATLGVAYWGIKTGVPMHLEQIQKGYESIERSHERQLDKAEQTHERNTQLIIDFMRENRPNGARVN